MTRRPYGLNRTYDFGASIDGLLRQLSGKTAFYTIKSTMLQEAQRMRKEVLDILIPSGIRHANKLRKLVRASVSRDGSRLYVRMSAKRNSPGTFWPTSKGKRLPIQIWLERGTEDRKTAKGKSRGIFRQKAPGGVRAVPQVYERNKNTFMPRIMTRLGYNVEERLRKELKRNYDL